jgi:hypothetical protein
MDGRFAQVAAQRRDGVVAMKRLVTGAGGFGALM